MPVNKDHQLLQLVLCLVNFTSYSITGLYPPFYQALLEDGSVGDHSFINRTFFRPVHTWNSGPQLNLNLVVFYATMFVCSFVFGSNIVQFGPRFLLLAGLFLYGADTIVAAFIALIWDHDSFSKLNLTAQVIGGCGKAMVSIATCALLGATFKKRLGMMFSFVVVSACLGLLAGPCIGSLVDEILGPIWSPVVLGSALVITMIPAARVIHVDKTRCNGEITTNLIATLGSSIIPLYVLSIFSAGFSISFVLNNQTEYLQHIMPYDEIRDIFASMGLSAVIIAPMAGNFNSGRRLQPPLYVTLWGAMMATLGALLLGSPDLYIQLQIEATQHIRYNYFAAAVLVTCGTIFQLIGGYTGMIGASLNNGMIDQISTHGVVAGLWSSTFATGYMLGPLLGHKLIHNLGYQCTTTILTGMESLVAAIAVVSIICQRGFGPQKSEEPDVENTQYCGSISSAN